MAQPTELKQKALEKCNNRCAYCGTNLTLSTVMISYKDPLLNTVDDAFFVINNIKKGNKDSENIYPACKPCTASKKNKTIEEWRGTLEAMLDYLRLNSTQFKTMIRFGHVKLNDGPVEFYFEKMEKQKTLES